MQEATAVIIHGKRYAVAGVIESGSRGREYQLKRDGLIVRVCHAPPYKVAKAIVSGESITYEWKEASHG